MSPACRPLCRLLASPTISASFNQEHILQPCQCLPITVHVLHIHSAALATHLLCLLAASSVKPAYFIHAALASCAAPWWIAAVVGVTAFIMMAVVWRRGAMLWRLPESDERRKMHAFLLEPLTLFFLGGGGYGAARRWAQACAAPAHFGWFIFVCTTPAVITGAPLCMPPTCCLDRLCCLAAPCCSTTSHVLPCPAGSARIAALHRWQMDWVAQMPKAAAGAFVTMLLLLLLQPTIRWFILLGWMSGVAVFSALFWHIFAPHVWVFVRARLSQATRNYLERLWGEGIVAGARALSLASRVAVRHCVPPELSQLPLFLPASPAGNRPDGDAELRAAVTSFYTCLLVMCIGGLGFSECIWPVGFTMFALSSGRASFRCRLRAATQSVHMLLPAVRAAGAAAVAAAPDIFMAILKGFMAVLERFKVSATSCVWGSRAGRAKHARLTMYEVRGASLLSCLPAPHCVILSSLAVSARPTQQGEVAAALVAPCPPASKEY